MPIPPKLSVALAERIGHALTAEEREVLDRPANRWFLPYWMHDLSKHMDSLIEGGHRKISEAADQLDELDTKRGLCPNCFQNALTLDCHVDFVPLCDSIRIDSDQ